MQLPQRYQPTILHGHNNTNSGPKLIDTTRLQAFALCALTSGGGTLTQHGRRERLQPDRLYTFEPEDGFCLQFNQGSRFGYLKFDLVYQARVGTHGGNGHLRHRDPERAQPSSAAIFAQPLPRRLDAQPLLTAELLRISSLWWHGGTARLEADACLALLVCRLLEHSQAEPPPTTITERAQAYARTHLDRGIGIADMAQAVGVSEGYLRRCWHRDHHQSPKVWLQSVRINRACTLLQPGCSVDAVATQCGYKNLAAFTRAFRRELGCTPRQWRQR